VLQTQVTTMQTVVQNQAASIRALQDSVSSLGSAVTQLQTTISLLTPAQASPVAWALIDTGGNVHSAFNITSEMVVAATDNAGSVCFYDLPFTLHAMGASPVVAGPDASYNQTMVSVGPNALPIGCDFPTGDLTRVGYLTAYNASNHKGPGPFEGLVVVWFW
jgi:hypothetical protein